MILRRPLMLALLGVCAAARSLGDCAAAPDASEPDPRLTPEQVIAIQLQALKNNAQTADDAGIRITFHFASPANRRMTGPLERFSAMLKNPLYGIMFRFEKCERSPLLRSGGRARQRVTLTDSKGERAIFLFVLSKQRAAPYENCWMTDIVTRLNPEHEKRMLARRHGDRLHAIGSLVATRL